jgi:hypothetical protein
MARFNRLNNAEARTLTRAELLDRAEAEEAYWERKQTAVWRRHRAAKGLVARALKDAAPARSPQRTRVIAELSGGRIGQPWRGYVALVQYEQDGATGEWLWPGAMSPE